MPNRSNHGINPVEDAIRKGCDANAGDGKLMMLIKVMVMAASFIVALGYLADRSSAQSSDNRGSSQKEQGYDQQISENAQRMMEQGKQIFRYDTFGSEDFWGGKLRLHEAIAGEKLGGVGSGVSPKTALSLGLKVDAQALPADLVAQIKAGKVDLDDPATTVALLKLNAVVGVTGLFNPEGKLRSIGLQCALCHSTVDDSFSPGIGKRLDGWGNRDLNVGAIVAIAPNLKPFSELLSVDVATVKAVLNSWGPGRYDAELNMDGKAKRPRRQERRDDDALSVWPGRRQPAHLDRRLGHGHLLERLRRQHADVRQGYFHRFAAGECPAISGRGKGRLGA